MSDRPRFEIDDREPCEDWQEEGDTGYCKNCGGEFLTHEPWLTRIFDWMEKRIG